MTRLHRPAAYVVGRLSAGINDAPFRGMVYSSMVRFDAPPFKPFWRASSRREQILTKRVSSRRENRASKNG